MLLTHFSLTSVKPKFITTAINANITINFFIKTPFDLKFVNFYFIKCPPPIKSINLSLNLRKDLNLMNLSQVFF